MSLKSDFFYSVCSYIFIMAMQMSPNYICKIMLLFGIFMSKLHFFLIWKKANLLTSRYWSSAYIMTMHKMYRYLHSKNQKEVNISICVITS